MAKYELFVTCCLMLIMSMSAGPAHASTGKGEALLTPQERQWLADHPVIRVAYEPQYAPFTFVDPQGVLRGISVDYIRLLERKLGIRIEVVPPQDLAHNLARIKKREADLLTSLMKTPERSTFLLFTKPYISVPAVIIVRKEATGSSALRDLHGKRVAVGASYAAQSYLERQAPSLRLVPLDNDVECLRKLSFGEVDAAVVDMASASHIIQTEGISNLKVVGNTGFTYELSLATRNDWPQLQEILAKGLMAITAEEANAISQRWITLSFPPILSRAALWAIAGFLIVVATAALGVFVWNRSLSRMVTVRSEELTRELAERRRVEASLRESQEINRSLFETLPLGIVYRDASGEIISANPAAERILGHSLAEMGGRTSFGQAIDENGAPYPPEQQPCMVTLATGKPVEKTVMGLDVPGRERKSWLEITAIPLFLTGSETPDRVYTLFEDITTRKEMAQQLRHHSEHLEEMVAWRTAELEEANRELAFSRDRAEAANRAKSQFLANMSHEIRTPLNGVLGNAQLLELTDLTEEQKEYLGFITSSANSLLTLLNDILDFTRIESGNVVPISSEFNLRSAIGDVIASQDYLIIEKGLEVKVLIPVETPVRLIGDQYRLKQILLQLLGNAIKFTDKGSIRIAVETIECHEDTALLSMSVADTGIGISPENVRKIFEPFNQVDNSDTRNYGGTGLGLSITRRLVELLGGEIRVESEPGKGTTFSFSALFRRLGGTGADDGAEDRATGGEAGMVDSHRTPLNPEEPVTPPVADESGAAMTPAPGKGIDRERLDPLLTELEQLLSLNRLSAKRVSEEIEELLADTAFSALYRPVSEAARKLKFREAQAALHDFNRCERSLDHDSTPPRPDH